MSSDRANNQLIYDNEYLIQKLKQEQRQRDYWTYSGYGENQNKCNKDQTCTTVKSDFVDVETDLFNLGRGLSKTDSTQYNGGNPPTLKPTQKQYCNPLIYPPIENNITKDLKDLQ